MVSPAYGRIARMGRISPPLHPAGAWNTLARLRARASPLGREFLRGGPSRLLSPSPLPGAQPYERYRLRGSPVRSRIFRPPPWSEHPFLHRTVGALQLLRHARPASSVHDRHRPPRLRLGHRQVSCGLRPLHLRGLRGGLAGRLDRGPNSGPEEVGALRRHHHRAGSLHPRPPRAHPLDLGERFLRRPLSHRDGNRTSEAQRERHRGRALPRRRWTARRRLFDLLHGHQHRRLRRSSDLLVSGRKGRLASGLFRRRNRHDLRA